MFFTGEDGRREFVFTEQSESDAELNFLLKTPEIVLFDDYSADTYDFRYVLTGNYGLFDKHLEILGITKYFPTVCDQLYEKFECAYKGIRHEEQFLAFSFTVFSWLRRHIDAGYYGAPLEAHLDKETFSFDDKDQESIINELSNRHSEAFNQILGSLRKYQDKLNDASNSLLCQEIKNDFLL